MKFSIVFSTLAALATTVSADFYIGILSGEMTSGPVGNPSLDRFKTGFVARDGESICDAGPMEIDVGTDPFGPWWNVCGEDFSAFCDGKQLYMDPNDSCGKNRAGDQTVGDGFFYADLRDKGNDDKLAGRCVFELGPQKTCFAFGSVVGEYTVRCYTDQC